MYGAFLQECAGGAASFSFRRGACRPTSDPADGEGESQIGSRCRIPECFQLASGQGSALKGQQAGSGHTHHLQSV